MGIIEKGTVSGTLPSKEAFAVHFPGYPSSISRAIETLGGIQGITEVILLILPLKDSFFTEFVKIYSDSVLCKCIHISSNQQYCFGLPSKKEKFLGMVRRRR